MKASAVEDGRNAANGLQAGGQRPRRGGRWGLDLDGLFENHGQGGGDRREFGFGGHVQSKLLKLSSLEGGQDEDD